MNRKNIIIQLGIALGAAIFFIPFLGQLHLFDWDEINFAESAREMIATGDYLTVRIFYKPFWEKPPLFIWMQVVSMKLFGINEFAARLPNAVCGIVTLLVLFNIGRKLFDERFGLLWVISFGCSLLPFLYFKSGIIDPWFNLFIFLSLFCWIVAIERKKKNYATILIIASAACLGLATLTKGPVSILVFGIVVGILFILNGFRIKITWKTFLLFILILTLVGGMWFLLQLLSGNADVIRDFIVYQIRLFKTKDAGHGGFPMFHFIILLFGVFPASIFAIQGHKYKGIRDLRKVFHIAMILLLWVVLLLFSLVKTKIVHYSSLTYFPISYLSAYSCCMIMKGKYNFRAWQKILVSVVGTFIALAIILLPVFSMNKQYFIDRGIITHSFTIGNLEADPGWTWMHSCIGLVLIAGILATLIVSRQRIKTSIYLLFFSSLLFISLALIFITPGVEKISQRAVIDFIQEKSEQEVYIQSFYKSFAPLFYGLKKSPENPWEFDVEWLTSGDIDKDAYFIMRVDKKDELLKKYPAIQILYEKNGYIFCVRYADK